MLLLLSCFSRVNYLYYILYCQIIIAVDIVQKGYLVPDFFH